ncbi:TPA: hypothetical protein PCY80_000305 [Klebsiella aerogenes]|nr:hypothetical protein [Klebsiella aerogenes]
MSTTYKDLVDSIKSYSGRTDAATINAIPTFINAAQTKLDSTLRVPQMLETKTITADGVSVPMPFMEIESVVIGEFEGVLHPYADVLAKRKVTTRLPYSMIYAVSGSNLELVAPADIIVTGYQQPPRLSPNVPTNAYTSNAENAILFASLSYLGVFARDVKAAQAWGEMADMEVQNINNAFSRFKSASGVSSNAAVRFF